MMDPLILGPPFSAFAVPAMPIVWIAALAASAGIYLFICDFAA